MSEPAAPPANDPAAILAACVPALSRNALFGSFGPEDWAALAPYLGIVEIPAGERVVEESGGGEEMYFVLEGEARLFRGYVDLGTVGPGAHFGEIALITHRLRAATVVSVTRLVLARLTRERYDALVAREPQVALRFTQALVGSLGAQVAEMTDSVGLLLRERSLPRRVTVDVTVRGVTTPVRTGTPLRSLLPDEVGGAPVVAALLGHKAVALGTPVTSESVVEPLTTAHWEGARVYRQSLGLLLLEAAARVDPAGVTRLGPSLGFAQRVTRAGESDVVPVAWAERVQRMMKLLVAIDAPFRQELWSVDEARSHFEERGLADVVLLLRAQRDNTVRLVSCGEVYALGIGPLLPSTGIIGRFPFRLVPAEHGYLLHYGDEEENGPSELVVPPETPEPPSQPRVSVAPSSRPPPLLPRRADGADELWLGALGVTSVGAFNQACIVGSVSQIIRVCEGLHEKRIGQIADTIAARVARSRVITIAGPSSSGKTTFIKRLTVQLQVDGIHPVGLSLDDYYLDRDRTPVDASGQRDYEAVEALDLPLLRDHLHRILRGDAVKTARFDFQAGKSIPDGGPLVALRPTDVLLLEGIHGLNPRLIDGAVDAGEVFRIFIQPSTALAFDPLTRVNVSDLRLLRRIVRDRHQRGTEPADNILRWPSVRAGERMHIFPFLDRADVIFDSALVYEPSVIKVFADRYLLEVPEEHPAFVTAHRLRRLIDKFVTIYPDHVPPTSILREFIGGSGFEY
jgi:uridine kinase